MLDAATHSKSDKKDEAPKYNSLSSFGCIKTRGIGKRKSLLLSFLTFFLSLELDHNYNENNTGFLLWPARYQLLSHRAKYIDLPMPRLYIVSCWDIAQNEFTHKLACGGSIITSGAVQARLIQGICAIENYSEM